MRVSGCVLSGLRALSCARKASGEASAFRGVPPFCPEAGGGAFPVPRLMRGAFPNADVILPRTPPSGRASASAPACACGAASAFATTGGATTGAFAGVRGAGVLETGVFGAEGVPLPDSFFPVAAGVPVLRGVLAGGGVGSCTGACTDGGTGAGRTGCGGATVPGCCTAPGILFDSGLRSSPPGPSEERVGIFSICAVNAASCASEGGRGAPSVASEAVFGGCSTGAGR